MKAASGRSSSRYGGPQADVLLAGWLRCGIGGRALLRAEMKKKVGTDCDLGHVNGFRFSSKGNGKLVKVKNKGDVG